MKQFITSILLIISFAFTGCEKEAVNVKVPKVEPKLVVQSYISPQDTLLVVYVTQSNPVFGRVYHNQQNNRDIIDAIVTLSDGTNSINLEYSSISNENEYFQKSAYTADPALFPIFAGKTYTLNVSTPEGKKAESSCIVPIGAPEINDFKLDSIVRNNGGWNHKELFITFSFKDILNQSNYYRLAGIYKTSYYNSFDDDYYLVENPLYFNENEMFHDRGKDGERISIKNTLPFSYGSDSGFPRPMTISISILSTDHHYFKYHQSMRESYNDNPFSEPVIIYSNIKGGLGVFGAFNKSTTEFKFE